MILKNDSTTSKVGNECKYENNIKNDHDHVKGGA